MASTPRTTESDEFDASKHGKAPFKFLSSAPQDAPAVRVGFVNPAVGYGLFAARDFAKDEFIFHEAPMMTALFNEKFSADKTLVQSQVAAYRTALATNRDVTVLAFPGLAVRFGIAPLPFDEAADVLASQLGRNLVHGRFAGSAITREQYESYTAGLPVAAANPDRKDSRDACLDFFKHYAFEVRQDGGSGRSSALAPATTREACVYLLGSLINHCCTPPAPFPSCSSSSPSSSHTTSSSSLLSCSCTCVPSSPTSPPRIKRHPNPDPDSSPSPAFITVASAASSGNNVDSSSSSSSSSRSRRPGGPNCSWRIGPSGLAHFVKPRHICVQARRAIREGEQLTWDYGKRDKGFACECETCRAGFFTGGLGYSCRVL